MKKAALSGIVLLAGASMPTISTPILSNVWSLSTGRGFFIPRESSVFSFRVTKENEGSGEWWLYGVDQRYFFARHPTERGSLHGVMTMLMSLFILLSMGFGAFLIARWFRYYSFATIVIVITFGVMTAW